MLLTTALPDGNARDLEVIEEVLAAKGGGPRKGLS